MKQYADIKDMRSLEAAQRQVAENLRHRESELGMSWQRVKDFYTPVTLFNHILDSFSPAINTVGIIADLYERVSDKVDDFRARRREKRERRDAEREVEAIRMAQEVKDGDSN